MGFKVVSNNSANLKCQGDTIDTYRYLRKPALRTWQTEAPDALGLGLHANTVDTRAVRASLVVVAAEFRHFFAFAALRPSPAGGTETRVG